MSYGKNWCFTINNPQQHCHVLLCQLTENENVNYTIFQLEVGELGTEHIQGYVQLKVKKRMNWLKDNVASRGSYRIAKGSAEQNRTYCSKEEGRVEGPFEYGEIMKAGRRSDLAEVRDMIKNNPHVTIREVAEQFPEVLAKYPRFISTLKKEYARPERIAFNPRAGWQSELSEALNQPPDTRQVRWYWESTGNVGKSHFATHWADTTGRLGYVVTGGRHQDITFAYDFERVVFFDYTRDNQETIPYSLMETFKNGYFLNTKYESTPVRFTPPHVVVFANIPPDLSKLSRDRWLVVEIK